MTSCALRGSHTESVSLIMTLILYNDIIMVMLSLNIHYDSPLAKWGDFNASILEISRSDLPHERHMKVKSQSQKGHGMEVMARNLVSNNAFGAQ